MKNKLKLLKNVILSKVRNLPYKINFAVTYICNSKCKICSIWKLYSEQPQLLKDELSLEEITKIFQNFPSTISWISLLGGEPFLRKNLSAIVHSAVKEIPSLAVISIPTNGLMENSVLTFLEETKSIKDRIIFIRFSLDGPPAVHNKIRGLESAYESTWNTYQKSKKLLKGQKNFNLGIETTVSSLNLPHLSPFLKDMASRGEAITITVAHDGYPYHFDGINGNIFPGGKSKEVREVIGVIKNFKEKFKPENLLNLLYVRRIPQFIDNPEKHIMPCGALKSSLFMDPFGNVSPCFIWDYKLGNLRQCNYEILKLLDSQKAKEGLNVIRNHQCPNCWTPCEAYQSIISNFITFKI
ncbi:MAG: SPASM domain-containing protein [Firmicutes bacterium]|nr:SPASM domain-containing protein [Bacillota bacterium]